MAGVALVGALVAVAVLLLVLGWLEEVEAALELSHVEAAAPLAVGRLPRGRDGLAPEAAAKQHALEVRPVDDAVAACVEGAQHVDGPQPLERVTAQ